MQCWFFTETIYYIAHLIRPGCHELRSCTSITMCGLHEPTNCRELRSILVLSSAIRQISPAYSLLNTPPHTKLCTGHPRNFRSLTEDDLNRIKASKAAFVSSSLIAFPSSAGLRTLNTDACDKHFGCMLLQRRKDETIWSVWYWLCKLYDTEKRYDITQVRFWGMVWSVLILRFFWNQYGSINLSHHNFLECV